MNSARPHLTLSRDHAEKRCCFCIYSKLASNEIDYKELRCYDEDGGDIRVSPLWICDEYREHIKRGIRQVRKL